MANWAISRVQSEGRKKVFEIDDQSRIAIITKIPYMIARPTWRFTLSTRRT